MLAFFDIFGKIEKRGKYNTKECSMKKFWNQIFRNLLAAIVAGLCYAGFAYWENGTVDFLVVLAMIGSGRTSDKKTVAGTKTGTTYLFRFGSSRA